MKSITGTLVALMLLSTPLAAADLVNVAGATKVAVGGYDPVAFFTESKQVSGSPSFTATHQGAVYYFASEETKKLFQQNPDKYVPQYGGFCAYGVAVGALFPVDISTWQVRDGKLYLNKDHDVLKTFNAEFQDNVSKADKNWPRLVAKNER